MNNHKNETTIRKLPLGRIFFIPKIGTFKKMNNDPYTKQNCRWVRPAPEWLTPVEKGHLCTLMLDTVVIPVERVYIKL